MLPSSEKDIHKFCCNRSTCPKKQGSREDASFVEQMNKKNMAPKESKETQISSNTATSLEQLGMPIKTAEKSSEANFDRNNQNLSNSPNKFCLSSSTQTSEKLTEIQTASLCLTIPPEPESQLLFKTPLKCVCSKLSVTSSSSSSTITMEHFPLKYEVLPKLQRKKRIPQKGISSYTEQFYSCSSEESQSDELEEIQNSKEAVETEKNIFRKESASLQQEELLKVSGGNLDAGTKNNISKLSTQDRVIEEKVLKSTSTCTSVTHLNGLGGCYGPCGCYNFAQGKLNELPIFNYPFMLPYNLEFPVTNGGLQNPASCAYNDKDNFKDCSSDLTAEQMPYNLPCICSNISYICPKHGALQNLIKRPVEVNVIKSITSQNEQQEQNMPKLTSSVELNENVDEELYAVYVDKIFTEPFGLYEPTAFCLLDYEDEEPNYVENKEQQKQFIEPSYSMFPNKVTDTQVEVKVAVKQETPLIIENLKEENILKPSLSTEDISTSSSAHDIDIENTEESRKLITFEQSEEEFELYYQDEDEKENDDGDDELIYEEELELAKEKVTESYNSKKHEGDFPNKLSMAAVEPVERETSCQQMKFFIDSLLMDLDAMKYAQRKTAFEKNVCKPKLASCVRDSFPVTIIEVKGLGANSLYVKWLIHDCCGIGGYEIYTDGYLTNRYYSGRHNAAVITHVDVTKAHKIALMAQPYANDDTIDMICGINSDKRKPKALVCNNNIGDGNNTHLSYWTPSIFLYDPVTC